MCMACTTANLDQSKIDAFAMKMVETLNAGGIALMTSIGHRTGLWDAMGDARAYTSDELAQKAELSERYVREWLGAVTTYGIVEYDAGTKKYRLPGEHAAFLTRAATPNNIAASMQWVAVLGSVEDEIVEAFGHGRGVPYASYARFHEVMAEESGQTTIAGLDEHIVPLVPGLQSKLESGIDVIDVGCGRGMALMHLAKRFPNSRFTGIDFSEEGVAAAQVEADKRELTNLRFQRQDAATWQAPKQYDLVLTFDAIHDQARPDAVLKNIHTALRPGGVYLMQDIKASSDVNENKANPMAPFIYTISTMHCMSVSLASGGMGLGAAWGRQLAEQMLGAAGFRSVQVNELPHDTLNYYYVSRKS